MACPLLETKSLPLIYNTFSFGGDDVLGKIENKFGEEYFNTSMAKSILEIRKIYQEKNYESLSDLRNFYNILRDNQCKMFEEKFPDENLYSTTCSSDVNRLKMVEALGGADKVKDIKVISIKKITDYLKISFDEMDGEKVVQFEDPAGRKGFAMIYDQVVVTFHQRYRETSYRGYQWVASCYPSDYDLENNIKNDMFDFIKKNN